MAEAVTELNSRNDALHIVVNPNTTAGDNIVNTYNGSYKQTTIHFNVALTVSDEGSSGGKIGVFGGWLGGAANSETKNQSQALTSLDFQLDVLLPQG